MKLPLLLCLVSVVILKSEAAENAESIIPTKTEYERYLDQVLLVGLRPREKQIQYKHMLAQVKLGNI